MISRYKKWVVTRFLLYILLLGWTFWYLALKVSKKTFFFKIKVCRKNVWFLNISEQRKISFYRFVQNFYMMNENVPNKKTWVKKLIKNSKQKFNYLNCDEKFKLKFKILKKESFLEFVIQFHWIYFIQVLLFRALPSII